MAGSIIATWLLGSAAIGTTVFAVVALAANFAISSIVTRFFAGKQKSPTDPGARQQIPPNGTNAVPTVYGDAYLGGIFVDAVLSVDQRWMYYVVAISNVSPGGQFSFDTTDFWYGDRKITFDETDTAKVISLTDEAGNVNDKIAEHLWIGVYTSTEVGVITSVNWAAPNVVMGYRPPPADPGSLVPAQYYWPASGRQMNGLAFAIIVMNYNQAAGTTSLQPITFKCTQNLYDEGAAYPGTVWADYITNSKYGGGIDIANVDLDSAVALNNYAQELIDYTDANGNPAQQPRYKINGVLSGSEVAINNLDRIMAACDSWTTYNAASGKWKIVINKEEAPAYSFDDANTIGDIRITTNSITQTVNELETAYPFGKRRDQTNYVVQKLPANQLYSNEPIHKASISLDLVNNNVQAKYLSNRILQQARFDINVRVASSFYAIQVEAGDVIQLTNTGADFNNKLFRVTRVIESVLPDGSLGAQLEMSEYDASVYATPVLVEDQTPANTNVISTGTFTELLPPPVVEVYPNDYPPYFVVETYVPSSGYVTTVWLYYRLIPETQYKLLDRFDEPSGSAFANGATVRFNEWALPAGEYYFKYKVGNNKNQSALSPSWPPGD